MKKNKIIAGLMAFTLLAGQTSEVQDLLVKKSIVPANSIFVISNEENVVHAASVGNGKRSGKQAVYISNLINPSITFCANSDSLIMDLRDYCYKMELGTSGFSSASLICSLGGFGGILKKTPNILSVLSKLLSSVSNVGKKAEKARIELMRLKRENSKRGIKLTIKTFGDWSVSYQ